MGKSANVVRCGAMCFHVKVMFKYIVERLRFFMTLRHKHKYIGNQQGMALTLHIQFLDFRPIEKVLTTLGSNMRQR